MAGPGTGAADGRKPPPPQGAAPLACGELEALARELAPQATWIGELPVSARWLREAAKRDGPAAEAAEQERVRATQLPERLVARFLEADLRKAGRPTIPPGLGDVHSGILRGRLIAQLVEVAEVSAPMTSRGATLTPPPGSTCTLLLTDGCSVASGMEKSPLGWLRGAGALEPGGKVVLDNVPISNGVLLLTPDNCRPLGGGVRRLREAALRVQRYQSRPKVGRREAFGTIADLRAAITRAAWPPGDGRPEGAEDAASALLPAAPEGMAGDAAPPLAERASSGRTASPSGRPSLDAGLALSPSPAVQRDRRPASAPSSSQAAGTPGDPILLDDSTSGDSGDAWDVANRGLGDAREAGRGASARGAGDRPPEPRAAAPAQVKQEAERKPQDGAPERSTAAGGPGLASCVGSGPKRGTRPPSRPLSRLPDLLARPPPACSHLLASLSLDRSSRSAFSASASGGYSCRLVVSDALSDAVVPATLDPTFMLEFFQQPPASLAAGLAEHAATGSSEAGGRPRDTLGPPDPGAVALRDAFLELVGGFRGVVRACAEEGGRARVLDLVTSLSELELRQRVAQERA